MNKENKVIKDIKKNIEKLDDKVLVQVAGGIKGTPGGNGLWVKP